MTALSKRDIDNQLKKIFSYRGTAADDLQTIEEPPHGTGWKKLAILFFAAGFLLSLIWGGFLFLGHGPSEGNDIKITFDGPKQLEPMKEYDFTATLENVSALDVTNVSFALDTTDQFFLTSSDPALDVHQQVVIGNLNKKEKRVVHFRGSFLAKEGDTMQMNGNVTYHPQSFNATFEASGHYSATMTEGVVSGSVDGPDNLLSGDEGTFTLSFAKQDAAPIDNLAISLDASPDFNITTSTVQPLRDNIWPLVFKDGAVEGQAIFKGAFSSEASGDRQITFLIGQLRNEKFFPTKAMTVPINVLGSEVSIGFTLNGTAVQNLTNPTVMHFGDLLSYAIDVSSTTKENLKNVRVILHAVGQPQVNGQTIVQWTTAAESPNAEQSDSQLRWTATEVPSFKNFAANSHEHLEGTVQLRPGPFPVSSSDYRLRVWAEVQLDAVGKIVKNRSLVSKAATIFIASDTAFNAEARYFDANGAAFGMGPLPPKVGAATTYRVIWRMSNSLHQLSNIAISAPLGEHVVLTGKNFIPDGIFSYDSASHVATWSLDSWPASTQGGSPALKNMEIDFEVGLTPTASDAGNTPTLVGPATLTATDITTGGTINLSSAALTTNITNDSFLGNKTTVAP